MYSLSIDHAHMSITVASILTRTPASVAMSAYGLWHSYSYRTCTSTCTCTCSSYRYTYGHVLVYSYYSYRYRVLVPGTVLYLFHIRTRLVSCTGINIPIGAPTNRCYSYNTLRSSVLRFVIVCCAGSLWLGVCRDILGPWYNRYSYYRVVHIISAHVRVGELLHIAFHYIYM